MTSTQPICITCLSVIGFGIKRICHQTGLAQTSVSRYRKLHGLTDPLRASISQDRENDRRRAKALSTEEARRAAKPFYSRPIGPRQPATIRQMERYYANHTERKKQAAAYARARYIKLGKNHDEYIRRVLRCRIAHVIRRDRGTKALRTMELVGCAVATLRAHLDLLFTPGMSWENYGEWEIDHRRPCASFNLADPAQQLACFHYTNLQPLWRTDNRIKHAKHPLTAA